MEMLLDTPVRPLRPPLAATPWRTVEVDERAARRSLREQVARLERELAATLAAAPPGLALDLAVPTSGGARLLSLGDLECLRDVMAETLRRARGAVGARAEAIARNRALVERMMLEPRGYKFARVTREDVGEPGCGGWEVRPRLGLIGMLTGWWEVKLSSGCPLAMGYYHRRRPEWGRNARLERALSALVLVVVVAVLFLFLFVYHDVPLRTS